MSAPVRSKWPGKELRKTNRDLGRFGKESLRVERGWYILKRLKGLRKNCNQKRKKEEQVIKAREGA